MDEVHQMQRGGQPSAKEPDILVRLKEAVPKKKKGILCAYLRDQVVKGLGLDPGQSIDYHQALSELGLDSLMAVELRTRLGAGLSLKRTLPATLLFDYPTIETLADYLANDLLSLGSSKAEQDHSHQNAEHTKQLTELEQLSEKEVEALLLKELSAETKGN
jgi:acyl carrier protein